MLRIIVLASFFIGSCLASLAFGQQIRVEKVKGNKAVVEFSGTALSPGRSYSLKGTSEDGDDGGGERSHVVGGSFDFQFYEYSSSAASGSSMKDNLIGIVARFGWNFEKYEFGPIAGYTNTESYGSSFSSVKFGAFGDYNLTPNRPGENSIYGAAAEGSYTSITSSNGGSMIGFFASGFAKWFVFGPSTALRVDLGYNYEKGSFTSYSSTTQGFAVRGGLATYF